MHKLTRRIRFSINPFLSKASDGHNPYASCPAGEGLAIFLELSVELTGQVCPDTGFIVNVTEIDEIVHRFAVPVFIEQISEYFRQVKHVGFPTITNLLYSARELLNNEFGLAKPTGLGLQLNPSRNIAINLEDLDMMYFSEKFEFAATHKLWNTDFNEEKNLSVFGKCANPAGHGHNYIIEVTVKVPSKGDDFAIGDFEAVVENEFIKVVDHKNLNIDVKSFQLTNPTVENISSFAWSRLTGKFGKALLDHITISENDRTSCSFYG
jgi:6-pyruvoyltetrahydropterin/6-carboxytetrahydropterin synthase